MAGNKIKNWMFVNKKNDAKFLEIRRYACGHYVFKQFVPYYIPCEGRNYMGCTLRQNRRGGVWHRISKKHLLNLLEDYNLVA